MATTITFELPDDYTALLAYAATGESDMNKAALAVMIDKLNSYRADYARAVTNVVKEKIAKAESLGLKEDLDALIVKIDAAQAAKDAEEAPIGG